MQLDYLKYIIAVKQYGSINKAAEKLYISQQYISKVLKTMEHESGKTLFVRSNHGVELTVDGEKVYQFAMKYTQMRNTLDEELTLRYLRDIKGNLRIGAVNTASAMVLPQILCRYYHDYPNIKNLFSDLEWEKLRQDDGHIYWIPQFSCIKNEEKVCTHNDEAFWIQARVLKWAGYPEIKTMDDYFNLIESYNEANPTMEDGTENIPYTILCDDWRYFCLENAPQFLDGYPNDGSCMVDPDTLTVLDYNTSDTAVAYFRKLNEEYQKGIVDPESFTQSYDEYISKLSTGRVLGMIDQWWDFSNANDAIKQAGLDEQGCDYIPVPVTIDGRDNQWHNSGGAFNESSGLAITTSCEDVEGALQFVNDLLDQDIHNLRFWGVEGTDYEVDENGEFYRTEEERTKQSDTAYKASHTCPYSYFPQYTGTSDDGINANKPDGQASEFFDGLNQDVKETFEAYGVETYVEMLGTNEAPGDWYPMWSFSNNFTTDTPGGVAWNKIADVKHEQLPQVVMAKDFDAAWDTYMDAYNACHPEDFISELQTELDTRMEQAAKFK